MVMTPLAANRDIATPLAESLLAEEYYQKVISYGPIAYWPLWDALGSPTAEELVNSPAQDGTHINVTCGQPGWGDGNTSCWYNGIIGAGGSFTNIWSPAFQAVFDGGEGTLAFLTRANGLGVWTDGAFRALVILRADANNRAYVYKSAGNNRLTWLYGAGGVNSTISDNVFASTDWMHIALAWSASTPPTGEMIAYYNGAQYGLTQTGLGAWAGVLSATNTVIGATTTAPTNPWHGWLQYVAVFDYAIPPAGILDLATV